MKTYEVKMELNSNGKFFSNTWTEKNDDTIHRKGGARPIKSLGFEYNQSRTIKKYIPHNNIKQCNVVNIFVLGSPLVHFNKMQSTVLNSYLPPFLHGFY